MYRKNFGRLECCDECKPSPCDPCVSCTTPWIEWDSVVASASKCGYAPFDTSESGPYKRYLSKTIDATFHTDQSGSGGVCGPDVEIYTEDSHQIITYVVDPATCAETKTCEGTFSLTNFDLECNDEVFHIPCVDFDCLHNSYNFDSEICKPQCAPFVTPCRGFGLFLKEGPTSWFNWEYSHYSIILYYNPTSAIAAIGAPEIEETTRTWSEDHDFGSHGGWTIERVDTLTTEFTDEMLFTKLMSAFPAFDNDWNDTAGSRAVYGTGNFTISGRAAKFRVRFDSSELYPSSYLKIWARVARVSDNPAEAVTYPGYLITEEYVWNGVDAGIVTALSETLQLPLGKTDYVQIKWSCQEDYEPAWCRWDCDLESPGINCTPACEAFNGFPPE